MASVDPVRASEAQAAWLRALERTAAIGRDPRRVLSDVVADLAATHGDRLALIADDETLSFAGLNALADRYANLVRAAGVAPGDAVCLMMPNRPSYLAAWVGITRAGGVAALVNTHARADALVHAITLVSPRAIIVGGADCAGALAAVSRRLPAGCRIYSDSDADTTFEPLGAALADQPTARAPEPNPRRSLDELALYIYTSGTTGLPKAARISHRRVMQWSHWFAGLIDVAPVDRMYNVLPMYHAIGGVVATVAPLLGGGSVKIAPRFSASRFWDDVVDGDCTLFQYIGELCRYLVNAAPHPSEQHHRLRLAAGNGLSPSVWPAFEARFRIPRILEYYAATEGTFSLYNCEGVPGAIGRIPPFLRARMPVVLVAHDGASGAPARGVDGLCIGVATGSVGEALGRLESRRGAGSSAFEGYTDAAQSDAKLVRDVLRQGDLWFRTGDLMRQDAQGFYYFVDRIGDTFRWKGENVSTTEVEAVLMKCPGVRDAIVYGVTVPGEEGRAGMATLVVDAAFGLERLWLHLGDALPDYARPHFLRFVDGAIAATGTFKPLKAEYARLGTAPGPSADRVFRADPAAGCYVPLTPLPAP